MSETVLQNAVNWITPIVIKITCIYRAESIFCSVTVLLYVMYIYNIMTSTDKLSLTNKQIKDFFTINHHASLKVLKLFILVTIMLLITIIVLLWKSITAFTSLSLTHLHSFVHLLNSN